MKRMEHLDSPSPKLNFLYLVSKLFVAFSLAFIGQAIDGINVAMTKYVHIVEAIKVVFQCGAWGAASFMGFKAFVEFLENRGWIKKGKPKK